MTGRAAAGRSATARAATPGRETLAAVAASPVPACWRWASPAVAGLAVARGAFGRGVFGRLAPLAAAFWLGACATLPDAAPPAGETLSGRLAIRIEGANGAAPRLENAAFELRGEPADGQLDLSTPLGSVLARARWSPGSVVLATPQGRSRYADLDALSRDVLGESVPVAALFDWLHGRPWAAAVAEPAATGFTQLGWSVDTARLGDGWVVARRAREPAVTVRARLDTP